MVDLQTDCLNISHEFWGKNFLLVSQPMLYHKSFLFYLRRSCRGGTPAAGTTCTGLFSERGESARGFTGKRYPPAQKKEARKVPGESLACPLRFQNAIPAPYAKFPQQG